MLFRLQILLFVVIMLLLVWITRQIKSRKLELRYTLSWLLLIVALLILVVFPQLLNGLSEVIGVQSPMNTLFLCGFVFSLTIIYTLTAAVSKQSEEIKKLTQKVALLEKKEKDLKTKVDEEE